MVTNNSANNATAASGKVLQGQGIGVASAFSTATYPATAGTASTILRSDGTNIVNTSAFKVSSGDVMTNTSQPSFQALNSTSVGNVTGDGTVYTAVFGTTNYDASSSYNNTTGIFTAPVTGTYIFNYQVWLNGILVTHTSGGINISTTTYNAVISEGAFFTLNDANGNQSLSGSLLARMTAGNTAKVNIVFSNGTKVVGFLGSGGLISVFSGALLF